MTKFYSFPCSNTKIPTISSRQKMKAKKNQWEYLGVSQLTMTPITPSWGEVQNYWTQVQSAHAPHSPIPRNV